MYQRTVAAKASRGSGEPGGTPSTSCILMSDATKGLVTSRGCHWVQSCRKPGRIDKDEPKQVSASSRARKG